MVRPVNKIMLDINNVYKRNVLKSRLFDGDYNSLTFIRHAFFLLYVSRKTTTLYAMLNQRTKQ